MSQLSNATVSILQTTYYDDFNEDKKFYRILFKPSYAVQARELTQLQTIIQKQISRFGDNIFKDGSIVDGVGINNYADTPFVRLDDSLLTGNVALNDLATGKYVITNGSTANAVRAIVLTAQTGFVSTYPNTNQLYLNYYYTGKTAGNTDVSLFSNGETLYIYTANQTTLGTLNANNLTASINVYTSNSSTTSTGNGYVIGVSEGVVYSKGFFQKVDRQLTVVSRHTSTPNNIVVGFNTVESFVTENQDSSLFDNAQGFTNYNAPGSHRLKLTPILTPFSKDAVSNTFFSIAEFDGGNLVINRKSDQSYNKINEALAQRTYEESGNYTINPYTVETTVVTGNSNAFFYEVSPGISYVRGNRIELINKVNKQVPRATNTSISQNQILTVNYGNYVFVDEVLGVPDIDNLGEVAIYDAAFNAISDQEGLAGGTSGNVVGYANIKSLLYYSGTKDHNDCKYYLYLFNIRMNPGKSFQSDAKSFYKSAAPRFKADVVLENSKAVIKDSSFTPLIFSTGLSAVKSLTPTGGSIDTSFIYRKTTTTTLNPNGTFTFALSGGLGAGGTERLFDTSTRNYQVSFTSNAYSSNLTGTVSVTTGCTVITGTSTTFQTALQSGDSIRVSNSTASELLTVNTISSNTSMTVTSSPAATCTAYTYQYYYSDGKILDLTDSMLSVNTSANTFTITTGVAFDYGSGNTMYAQYPVQRTVAVAASKVVNKARYVKIDCSNNAANSVGPWNLGLPDVYKIEKVHVSTAYSNTTADVSSWFTLDTGQRDDVYDHARLKVKPSKASKITGASKILVRLEHFEANTSAGIGFFSVDSYPVIDGVTSNSTTVVLAEIPNYNGRSLRDSIDFRPYKIATANSIANTDPANTQITVNPSVANTNTFNISAYGQYLPEADSQFTADYEYYLPRQDLVIMSPEGSVEIIQGNPEINPRVPLNITEGSIIAQSIVPAFPSLTTREGATYNRNGDTISIVLKSDKRFTMSDIGVLENRIKRLEYYTVLSALETAAKTTTIANESTGVDRFKNGIFTEPFNSHNFGNVGDSAYSIATSGSESVMRPKFNKYPVDLQYKSNLSSGVEKNGMYVTLPFTSEKFASQPYASKFRVCTESVWQWNGQVELFPQMDFAEDVTQAPAFNLTVDLAQPFREFAASAFGSSYDELDVTRTVTDSDRISSSNRTSGDLRTTTTTFEDTVKVTTSGEISQLKVDTTTNKQAVGQFVQDVSIIPFVREKIISFQAKSLKPNTKLHCFFDGINVDEHVAPGTVATSRKNHSSSTPDQYIVTPTAPIGTALTANSTGGIAGIFSIPAGTFRTGDRTFLITNVDDLDTGANAQITKASATYTASGLAISKSSLSLTTINPKLSVTTKKVTTTTTDTIRRTETSVDRVQQREGGGNRSDPPDPIAQSFSTSAPENVSGIYLTKLGVYFKQKDPTLGIAAYIVEMESGIPQKDAIVGQITIPASSIVVSDNASLETIFEFENPIYLNNSQEYAFIIEPVGNSPEPQIWLAETGGIDIQTGKNISSNPYSGIAFISANKSSWTPIQKEDIKFNLYRAKFTSTSGYVVFQNEDDEYLTVDSIVRANSSLGIKVGDVVYSQNSTSNTALTSSTFPFGVIQSYNEAEGKLVLDSARASFSNTVNPRIEIHRVLPVSNTSLSNSTLVALANVVSIDNVTYHSIVPKFAPLIPTGTSIKFEVKGTDTTYSLDSSYRLLELDKPNEEVSKSRLAMSRTNEFVNTANAKSTFIKATLTTTSEYIAPVLDLNRKATFFVENIINNDVTNEHTNNGNALCRYISKAIELDDGQDAEDIKIFLRAHRPSGTNIYVYGKFKSKDDPETFDTKLWTPMAYLNATDEVFSTTSGTLDLKEYEFGFANTAATTKNFNANTGVSSAGDTIAITNNPFSNNTLVRYFTNTGNTVISGLANSTFYYVVASNSSVLALSSSQGGANINITASSTIETGHNLEAYIPTIAHTAFINPENSNIMEYYNNNDSRFQSYKYFAIKIVLTSASGSLVPKLNDMRAIALQV